MFSNADHAEFRITIEHEGWCISVSSFKLFLWGQQTKGHIHIVTMLPQSSTEMLISLMTLHST
jgi:hypothetical protein